MSPKAAAAFFRINCWISLVAFGIVWAFGAHPATRAPALLFVDLLTWPINGDPSEFGEGAPLMSAIGGGVTAALGYVLATIVAPAIERGDRAIVRHAIAGLTLWFVVDSSGSIASGAVSNAIINVAIYLSLVGPMLAARRA